MLSLCCFQTIEACNFEGTSACSFTGHGWIKDNWSAEGPRFDHTLARLRVGMFLYSRITNSQNAVTSAIWPLTPVHSQPRCIAFYFFMSGPVGTLDVFLPYEGQKGKTTNQ